MTSGSREMACFTTVTCPSCTFENHPDLQECEVCSTLLVRMTLGPHIANQEKVDVEESYSIACPKCSFMNAESAYICSVCDFHFYPEDEVLDSQTKKCPRCTCSAADNALDCGVCGYSFTGTNGPGSKRARKGKCFFCSQEGHWTQACPTKNRRQPGAAAAAAGGSSESDNDKGMAMFSSDSATFGIIELLASVLAQREIVGNSSRSAHGINSYFKNNNAGKESVLMMSNNGSYTAQGTARPRAMPLSSAVAEYRLCSSCVHISQRGYEGAAWSCGYRNIQMLCSSLLAAATVASGSQLQGSNTATGTTSSSSSSSPSSSSPHPSAAAAQLSKQYKSVMFNGNGEIPDVNGIQAWIEKAWSAGFDLDGEAQLGSILGTDTWIGAVECAAMLRYFGIRAIVVDFKEDNYTPAAEAGSDDAGWVTDVATARALEQEHESRKKNSTSTDPNREKSTAAAASSSASSGVRSGGDNVDGVIDLASNGGDDNNDCSSSNNGDDDSTVKTDDFSSDDDSGSDFLGKPSKGGGGGGGRGRRDRNHPNSTTKASSSSLQGPVTAGATSAVATPSFFSNQRAQRKKQSAAVAVKKQSTAKQISELQRRLVQWVQRYFMEFGGAKTEEEVAERFCPSLFFQHQGHSRTIVGYQTGVDTRKAATVSSSGGANDDSEYLRTSLLVFDPASDGLIIKTSLIEGTNKWCTMLKRGLHTITRAEYQLVYVAPGIMSEEERERSKLVVSISDFDPLLRSL